jgi:hypothetical protein
MRKLAGGVGATIAGTIVGFATARFGTMTSFMLGTIASGAGLYYGRRVAEYFDL